MLTTPAASDVTFAGGPRNLASPSPFAGASKEQIRSIMSSLVHDLRQPLSTIELCADYLNLILSEAEPKARQQVGILQAQIEDVNRLIGEALHLLRASTGLTEAQAGQDCTAAS